MWSSLKIMVFRNSIGGFRFKKNFDEGLAVANSNQSFLKYGFSYIALRVAHRGTIFQKINSRISPASSSNLFFKTLHLYELFMNTLIFRGAL